MMVSRGFMFRISFTRLPGCVVGALLRLDGAQVGFLTVGFKLRWWGFR